MQVRKGANHCFAVGRERTVVAPPKQSSTSAIKLQIFSVFPVLLLVGKI